MQIADLSQRLSDKDITIDLSPAAVSWILECSYNPVYGARPLRRFIEKHVTTELSKKVVSGELLPHSRVLVDRMNDDLRFVITPTTPRATGATPAADIKPIKLGRQGSDFDEFIDDDVAEEQGMDVDEAARQKRDAEDLSVKKRTRPTSRAA